MGADGGIVITKVDDIKKEWNFIKSSLIKMFQHSFERAESWQKQYQEECLTKSKELPDNIMDFSGEKIIHMFQYLANCDCPYLYGDIIITAKGDYVSDCMDTLSRCLQGEDSIYIETWT